MTEPTAIFIDEFGNLHERESELGRGGQGAVYRTRDPNVALKLVLNERGHLVEPGSLAARLRAVRLLPIPPDLPLSMPAAVLRDHAGYAMRLLTEMVPFKHFWPNPGQLVDPSKTPAWLADAPEAAVRDLTHYARTGGLRRRLLSLYKCSALLARLHAAGLVYGDVSPANAYISAKGTSRTVWMIDADNLRFETEGRGPGVFTPQFGAPELVQGLNGGCPRTDCHAFAVMAFYMLTLQHPLLGDYVENGPGGDWADDDDDGVGDLTEKALAGLLPWIDDEDDDTNATAKGLPRSLVLTPALKTLFQETFGPGRVQPFRRPAIFHWPSFLARALDGAITCPACKLGYYDAPANPEQKCPFCEAERPMLLRAVAGEGEDVWSWLHPWLTEGHDPIVVPHRLFYPLSLVDGDRDVLEISAKGDGFQLRCPEGMPPAARAFSVAVNDGSAAVEITTRVFLPPEARTLGFTVQAHGSFGRRASFQFHQAVP